MDINSLKGSKFIGVRADNIRTIIDYFLKDGGSYSGTLADDPVGFTYFINDGYVCGLTHQRFEEKYPLATIICLDNRCLPISLEEARKWYFSSNTDLQMLALRVYSVQELLPTYNEIFAIEECKALTEKEKAHRALSMVAKYFNQGWTKTLGSTGFFIAMGVHGDRVLELPTIGIAKHESVIYPGVVYFRKKSYIHLAARILGKEVIEELFA